jgi:hypothetical protein
MTSPDPATIEDFVRGTLGCQCPDDVFRSVAIDRLAPVAGRPPVLQLMIGARLLIHIVATPPDGLPTGWIEQLAANGRATRDRHGCNRFRLVIASPDAHAVPGDIDGRFSRAVAGDDRAHLHLLAPGQLPAGLEVPSPPACSSPLAADTVAK